MELYRRGKTWWVDHTEENGRRHRVSTRKKGKREAERVAGEWIAKLGDEPAAPRRTRLGSSPPFDLAVEAYIEMRIGQGKRASSYDALDKGFWAVAFAGRRLDTITSDEIEGLLREWKDEHSWSNATRNNRLAQLAGLFSYGYGRRWISQHPTEKGRVPALEVRNARARWLRPHEVEAICNAEVEAKDENGDRVKRRCPEWLQQLVIVAVSTGLRLSRICDLRKSDFEVDAESNAYLVVERDKNGERVYKMIEGALRELIERRVEASVFPASHLLPGPGGKNAQSAIKRWLPRYVRAANLKWGRKHRDGVTFHVFRHSYASNALNAGVPEHVVQQMGNWKDRRMLARYAHLSNDRLREGEATITALWSPAASQSRHNRSVGTKRCGGDAGEVVAVQ